MATYNMTDCENCDICYADKQCKDCTYVFNSALVEQSQRIYNSTSVFKSEDVYNSKNVELSNQILYSTDCSHCGNIVKSLHAMDSLSCIMCDTIDDCSCLRSCKHAKASHYCANCNTIRHCMFCHGLEDAEYMIFNHEVAPAAFERYEEQFKRFHLGLTFNKALPTDAINNTMPSINSHPWEYYELDPLFVEWLETLPNYDWQTMYRITMNSIFIESAKKAAAE